MGAVEDTVVNLDEAIMATDKSDWRSRDFENDDGHPPNSMPFVQCVADA